jgi:uncharacterized protein (DUF2235 family)
MTPLRAPGKAIVLLSDGTGNSSAKLMKTNVWRMYEALDLSTGDQIALYDNGVGTSGFKLFAILGGALGWGLKRNVRNLYMFACRNYQPATDDRDADRLYAFGFSRGAFTIRVLNGLIEDQGLVTGLRGRALKRQAKQAYREYRRKFNATKILVNPLRWTRDVALRQWTRWRGLPQYDKAKNQPARVRFLGLWDTVDAYGLPVDEMTRGWDKWVWPLSMCEQRPQNVDKICHAVALDDERHTFHPVLLDEAEQPPAAHTNQERYTQVWFAGMHSNVGGGYPDDSLARVSLRWMAAEAGKTGLRLHPIVREEWDAHVDPHGPAGDSRRGLGAYYRYNPRSIQKLTDDRFADVTIARPKIHESVFQRIAAGRDDYAPIVLPDRYAVVTGDGALVDGDANPYEHPTQRQSRCADQERVWNQVFLRRIVYFATIAVTLALLVPPFIWTPEDVQEGLVPSPAWRAGATAIQLLDPLVPDSLQSMTDYYYANPAHFAVLGALLAVLMSVSWTLQRGIQDRMRLIWAETVKNGPTAVIPHAAPTDLVYRWRTNRLYRNVVELVSQRVFPFVFGLLVLLVLVLIVIATVNRAVFAVAGVSGNTCRDTETGTQIPEGQEGPPVHFRNDDVCKATGVVLEQGQTYAVRVELPAGGWSNGGLFGRTPRVDTTAGFSSGDEGAAFLFALPFRRVLTVRWFVPIARIGMHLAEYHPLDQEAVTITPRRSGQLFLFVNDAIPPWPLWSHSYMNNTGGSATVTITRALVSGTPP